MGGLNLTTTFDYDADGNRVKVTDPQGSFVTYQFDGLNRLISTKDELNPPETYTYDGDGNVGANMSTNAAPSLSLVFDNLNSV